MDKETVVDTDIDINTIYICNIRMINDKNSKGLISECLWVA